MLRILAQVAATVADILGRQLQPDEPLMAAGLDSLASVELTSSLQTAFDLPLPATLAMDYPCISAIAALLHSRLPQAAPAAPPGKLARAAQGQQPRGSWAAAVLGASVAGAGGPQQGRQPDFQRLGGLDAVSPVPYERWDAAEHAHLYDGAPVAFGAFLPGGQAAGFDAPAFGLSNKEATATDPQQRLLLGGFAEALASAGAAGAGLLQEPGSRARFGVFVGVSAVDYSKLGTRLRSGLTAYSATGTLSLSVAAGRVSFTFGLRGPAVAVDTACSSSLVAAHSAVTSMQLGHCSAAAAAGANLMLVPDTPAAFQRAGMLSVEGRCKTLDAAADGYVRAEGVGVLLLQVGGRRWGPSKVAAACHKVT
jgi:acyl carrier protein